MNRPSASQLVFLLVLLPLISACAFFAATGKHPAPSGGSSAPSAQALPSCPHQAPITGTILQVNTRFPFRNVSGRGAILVDGAKKQLQGHLSRVFYLSIMKDTQILEQEGNVCHGASVACLKVGQHIQAQLMQPIAIDLSNPPIIYADKLVILLPAT